jgi:hypothetical protein
MHTCLANKQDEKKISKPTIKNKIDSENWKNHTVNLIEGLEDKQIGNTVLLSYIEVKPKVWINAKTGTATELAIKENEKKADCYDFDTKEYRQSSNSSSSV